MITFTSGNLLDSKAEALVNTVNTVGVMGKGIALMFKEAFDDNFKAYKAACKREDVRVGQMFVTERHQFVGPKWIINFPTKKHWRSPSEMEWIEEGLEDLKRVILERNIRSIALPPLGSGNGGLNWYEVRVKIEAAMASLSDVEVIVYEPTSKYQNVAKRQGVEALTPARALVAELVRRYWILGIECSLLEIQKLAYFLERNVARLALDGSYLHCDKRLGDAGPLDVIWFDDERQARVAVYLATEAKLYQPALEATSTLIDGFESPLGMELLATVDWLLHRDKIEPTVPGIRLGLKSWSGGQKAAARKQKLFDDRLIGLALERLAA
jgi:O-acetyl-ADP-ribose deacetylase (regulator of RNase III)